MMNGDELDPGFVEPRPAWLGADPREVRTQGPISGQGQVEYRETSTDALDDFVTTLGPNIAQQLYRDDWEKFNRLYDSFRSNATGFADWWKSGGSL